MPNGLSVAARIVAAVSVICAPLVSRDKITGILYLHSSKVAQEFSSEDLELATAISLQAGMAISAFSSGEVLRKTLVSAERSALELKDQARREAEIVMTEAHSEARLIKQAALTEREHLRGEASRIRSLLRSALAIVDDGEGEERAEAA